MINNQTHLRPNTYLIESNKQYPHAWKIIDEYIQKYRGNWPKWNFLPLNANFLGLAPEEFENKIIPPSIFLLPSLAAWRATQGVYRFDPDVLEPIWDTPISGKIPTDVLFKLPEWCVYIETGVRDIGRGRIMHGFFASLDFSMGDPPDVSEYIILIMDLEYVDSGKNQLNPYIFPLKIGVGASPTIEEMISIYMNDQGNPHFLSDPTLWSDSLIRDTVSGDLNEFLPKMFSLLLYLCCENAEFRGAGGNANPLRYPAPTRTKKGERYFPPNQPKVWATAWRIGSAIRTYKQQTTSIENRLGEVKRPHIRRAHWHSYWVGSFDGERTVRIKWLSPILVNVDSPDNLIPVVRGVE